MKKLAIALFTLAAALMTAAAASAQTQNLAVTLIVTKSYPSLTPLVVLKVSLADVLGVDPKIWRTVGWSPESPAGYSVTDAKTGARIPISAIEFPAIARTHLPDYSLAYLVLSRGLKDGDTLTISISGSQGVIAKTAAPLAVKGAQKYSLNFNPTAAPAETLINGVRRDVGQLNIAFNLPELVTSWHFARTYLKTTDLFSTDENDSKSKFNVTTGIERSLTSRWYVPAHVEAMVQGDQIARNASFLAGAGLSTVFPWKFAKPALYNSILQIPLSPVLTIDAQYERRIQRDAPTLKKLPNSNDFRLAPVLAWKPIRFLPGPLGQDTVDFEINAKGWYLPFDQINPAKRGRFEGAGDVSLLVPLAKLNFLAATQFLGSADPIHSRIRVKYAAGANDAAAYKHARQLTFGIELIK